MYSFNEKDHIHLLNGVPLIGTTTALNVIEKPLTWWASGMACSTMGWRNPKKEGQGAFQVAATEQLERIKKMAVPEYMKLLDTAYRAHNARKEKAADEGTDRHALVEQYINAQLVGYVNQVIPPEIEPFHLWAKQNVKRFLFSEVHCYSEPLWVGGIADFGYENMAGEVVLCDLKSSREPYFVHWAQIAGYDIQIQENGGLDSKGNKVFTLPKEPSSYAVFCAGYDLGKPFFETRIGTAKKAFCFAVNLYREKMYFEKGNYVGKAR